MCATQSNDPLKHITKEYIVAGALEKKKGFTAERRWETETETTLRFATIPLFTVYKRRLKGMELVYTFDITDDEQAKALGAEMYRLDLNRVECVRNSEKKKVTCSCFVTVSELPTELVKSN